MKVTAKATRSGDWWAIEVPEVPGAFTQAKRLDQVADMVRDAVSLLEDVAPESVEVDVEAQVDEALAAELTEARMMRVEASLLEERASAAIASVAQRLSESGLTLRDIGVVLGVSHQRVGQLVTHSASGSGKSKHAIGTGSGGTAHKIDTGSGGTAHKIARAATTGRFVAKSAAGRKSAPRSAEVSRKA